MKNIKYKIGIFLSLTLLFSSCQDDDGEVGTIIAPSNITISHEIVGADASNPNGDGTGVVNFTASSNDAITYRYDFGDNTDIVVAPTGEVTHRFSLTGLNTYSVTVLASGIAGITSASTINIDVYSSFEDQEAKDFLSGGAGNNKTWYWAADVPGNIGLGPNTVQAGGEHTWSQWFTSSAWHSDKLCMYDAEFVFSQASNGDLTFEQLTDIAYTPGDYAASVGVAGESCHDNGVFPNLDGVKNVSFSPSSSIATLDGEYRGTTISFSDGGFMCWWVGSSKMEIITITDSSLFVRIEEGPRAWYIKFQTTKAVQ
jgi:hypothetical protein